MPHLKRWRLKVMPIMVGAPWGLSFGLPTLPLPAKATVQLGPPNDLADLRRQNAAFWDAYATGGCRYVSVTVQYDADGRVEWTRVRTFWHYPWERRR